MKKNESLVWADIYAPKGTGLYYFGNNSKLKSDIEYHLEIVQISVNNINVKIQEFPEEWFELKEFKQKITF
jgi:hypothetical protein